MGCGSLSKSGEPRRAEEPAERRQPKPQQEEACAEEAGGHRAKSSPSGEEAGQAAELAEKRRLASQQEEAGRDRAPGPPGSEEARQAAELAERRRLTPQQEEANALAAARISAIFAESADVPASETEPARDASGRVWWDICGGQEIERALEHTPLVDLEYVVLLARCGGVMPRRQEMPPCALVTQRNLWRVKQWQAKRFKLSLGLLVLSYPWLDWFHPDREGAQLRQLLPVFEAMLAEAKCDSPHCTVGVLIDFMCLPQRPFASPEEKLRQRQSLSVINLWYFHEFTHVLLVTTPPPPGCQYGTTRPHTARGWCHFEKLAAMVATKPWLLLDFSKFGGASEFGNGGFFGVAPDSCCGQMRAGRSPPASPEDFGRNMRAAVETGELKFTSKADMEHVIQQYSIGFVETIQKVANRENRGSEERTFGYEGLGWSDADADQLLKALRAAAELCSFPHGPVNVVVRDNPGITEEKFAELQQQLGGKFTVIAAPLRQIPTSSAGGISPLKVPQRRGGLGRGLFEEGF